MWLFHTGNRSSRHLSLSSSLLFFFAWNLKSFSMMYCMSLPIFCYHSAYRGGEGYLSICYLCQVPFSPVLVFVEDFPSLPRIVYLLDVSSALPRLQRLLTAQGNLIAAFWERCSGVILQTTSMNLLVGVVISLFYFRATFLYSLFPLPLLFYQFFIKLYIFKYFNTNTVYFYLNVLSIRQISSTTDVHYLQHIAGLPWQQCTYVYITTEELPCRNIR